MCDQSMCIRFWTPQVQLTADIAAHCDSLQSGHYNVGAFLSGETCVKDRVNIPIGIYRHTMGSAVIRPLTDAKCCSDDAARLLSAVHISPLIKHQNAAPC